MNAVINLLNEKHINYTLIKHPACYTISDMEKVNINDNGLILKNLFLRNKKKTKYYLLSCPYNKTPDLKAIAKKLKETNLSFASIEDLAKYLSLKKGSLTPFGVINDKYHETILVFDKSLTDQHKIGVHPNTNEMTVFLKFNDLITVLTAYQNKIIYIDL